MQNLNTFFQSDAFVDFWHRVTVMGFWLNLPVFLFIVILIIRMDKKYKRRRNEIKKLIQKPGMEEVRWLLKSRLENHGIEPDDQAHENN